MVATDLSDMTIRFLTRRRATTECAHPSQVRTETAGLRRDVCETCGRVSVGYVANHRDTDGSSDEDVSPGED